MTIVGTIIGALFGTSGLVAGFKVWTEWQSTRELRRTETAAQAAARDDAREESAFIRMERAMERMDRELTRTAAEREQDRARAAAEREQDRARIADLETAHQELAEENRTFRTVIAGVVNRLRRKPPDSPEAILAYILEHLPFLGKDPS
ncbi:hypothetical protein [Brachybacterium phenoliresistens]|uniref:hypothetical protein n=1 Tax=Brachybacterium phenoliresistens TaxID=396014 RepID=UPI0031DC11AC